MTRRLRVATIVEGPGDASALPTLLQRIGSELVGDVEVVAIKPHSLGKSQAVFASTGNLTSAISLAAKRLRNAGRSDGSRRMLLVLLDADADCPVELVAKLRQRIGDGTPCSVVLANRDYETWLVGGASGFTDLLRSPKSLPGAPEASGLGVDWLKNNLIGHYAKTVDQKKLTKLANLHRCREVCPSFDKLCRELEKALED